MNDIHQRSGRTTRMIEEGKKLWSQGRAVYLIFSTDAIRQYWHAILKDEYPGLSCETVRSVGMNPHDLRELKARGAWPNCVFLFDHYIMQSEIYDALQPLHKIIKESHRWDDLSKLPEGIASVEGLPNAALIAADLLRKDMLGSRTYDLPHMAKSIEAYHQEQMLQQKVEDLQYALRKVLHMCEDIRGEAMNELGSTEPDTGAWNASSVSNATYIEGMDSLIDELEKKLK